MRAAKRHQVDPRVQSEVFATFAALTRTDAMVRHEVAKLLRPPENDGADEENVKPSAVPRENDPNATNTVEKGTIKRIKSLDSPGTTSGMLKRTGANQSLLSRSHM